MVCAKYDLAQDFAKLSGSMVGLVNLALAFVYSSSSSTLGTLEIFEVAEWKDEEFMTDTKDPTFSSPFSPSSLVSSLLHTLFLFNGWGIKTLPDPLKLLRAYIDPERDINTQLQQVEPGTGIAKFLSHEEPYFPLWAYVVVSDCRGKQSFKYLS